ncbi:HlyD family secretion protein [Serratia proteamaculans]|uniref:HlyD family efflux transporter periplasmic adaptor subunit n=1 Tax=Serratia proteamaculans TaxID=28151 RepID=A0A5Q2VD50_SERPR|nr:HlyD family efflux transporter periplasmic adaptor subunit [Serratia proteamaculans]QGH62020.1 HlyD family efflux transporter periplasmic adaptor subunit [Serratia proteamaculans]
MGLSGLFRMEAINAGKEQAFGSVIIATPISIRICAVVSFFLLVVIMFFISTYTYTNRTVISGYLTPDKGLSKIYPSQYGVIRKSFVIEGSKVKEGDTLFILSSERHTVDSEQASTQEKVSHEIKRRVTSLQRDLMATKRQYDGELITVQQSVVRVEESIQKLNNQKNNLKQVVAITKERLDKYSEIYNENYISLEQKERVREEFIEKKSRLDELDREILNAKQEKTTRVQQIAKLKYSAESDIEKIKRELAQLEQDLLENETRREIIITAPVSGVITALNAWEGKYTDGNTSLASIIPDGSRLVAWLYAPGRSIGFIRPDSEILLRYQPWPWQKFGQYPAIITSISRSTFALSELTDELSRSNDFSGDPSFYRIIAKPMSEEINAYGQTYALRSGARLEASILLDKRTLLEWMFEPFLSLKNNNQQ